jgi:tetratricopeptide (TPR) repeat protein
MKNLNLFAILIFLSCQVFGQSALDDAKKEIDKENYIKAKNILLPVLKDGSGDREKVPYFLGNAYLKNDDPDSAKIFYRLVGGAEDHSKWGLLAYGRLNLLNGNVAEAEKLFEQSAVKSNMRDAEILYQIGDALYSPNVTDINKAIGYFEDAYKIDNKNYVNMLELGDAYLKNSEGGKAMSKYESASELYPKLILAFIKIGRLATSARTYDDAISAYQKAIAIEPDYAIAHKELAEAYYLSKKYDLAKPEFKKYIELNKDDADAKTKFLTFLFQIKEYDQCASESQSMLGEDPTNFLILRALFYSDYELKRYKEGMEIAQRFWVAAPVSRVKPFDYVETAKLATKTGDTSVALKYFTIALQVDSNNDELLSDYALLMYNTKRYYDAAENYARKINRFPNKVTFYDYYYLGRSNYYIGLSFKSKKDNAAAKDSASFYFVQADSAFSKLTSNTNYATYPDSWQWRAKANYNLDPEMKTGAAKPFYEQYIKVAEAKADPANPTKYKTFLNESYQYLGAYYLNAKDKGNAKIWLDKAEQLDPGDETTKELMKSL